MNTETLQSLVEGQSNPDEEIQKDSENSTRTTFKITKGAVNDLSWLADYYGVTLKRMVDHIRRILESMKEAEDALVEAAGDASLDDTTRKAVAIDPNTREKLNDLSDELDVSRDRLVEVGIQLAKMFAEKKIVKQREELDKIRKWRDKGLELEKELTDDALQRGVGRAVGNLIDLVDHAERALANEEAIELPF